MLPPRESQCPFKNPQLAYGLRLPCENCIRRICRSGESSEPLMWTWYLPEAPPWSNVLIHVKDVTRIKYSLHSPKSKAKNVKIYYRFAGLTRLVDSRLSKSCEKNSILNTFKIRGREGVRPGCHIYRVPTHFPSKNYRNIGHFCKKL